MYKALMLNEDMLKGDDHVLDDASLKILFKEYFAPLCAYCQYKFDFDNDSAKEVVHTAFIKLWENRHTPSHELSIKAYLYKVVSNLSLDMLRHEKVKQKHIRYTLENTAISASDTSYSRTDLKKLAADIDAAIAELPEQMRRIFELSRYENLRYAQIADELNISIKTVETQMSRALLKLRKKLARYLTIIAVGLF